MNRDAALDALRSGTAIGRQSGIARAPWFSSCMFAELCMRALEADIETDHVCELVRRCKLRPEPPPLRVKNWPWEVEIRTFGKFEVRAAGQLLHATVGKTQELLQALIALGPRSVSAEMLVDALWPDTENARSVLYTTVHRLRKWLGNDDVIRMTEGSISLDPHLSWTDVAALTALFARIDHVGTCKARTESHREHDAVLAGVEHELFALYRSRFLPSSAAPWAIHTAERFGAAFVRAVTALADAREQRGHYAIAVETYRRAIDIDDQSEALYVGAMRCFEKMGKRVEAAKLYERCRLTLYAAMRVEPSLEMTALYNRLRGSGGSP